MKWPKKKDVNTNSMTINILHRQYNEAIEECQKAHDSSSSVLALDYREVYDIIYHNCDMQMRIDAKCAAQELCDKLGTTKRRVPSVEEMYDIFMQGWFYGKGENITNDGTVVFTKRGTLNEEVIKEKLEAIHDLIEGKSK